MAVTITYYDKGSWSDGTSITETDVVRVCETCADRVEAEAESHGYDVERQPIG